jgi:phage-related minor tail protein
MVEGTKSVKDAFKDMARSIIKELYDVYVVQRLVGGFGENGSSGSGILGLLGGLFGKASGGTVMSNQPYLVGEKGPELIVPRNRGHVMNADLTAEALGGGGGVTVVQHFNFQANGDESVKKLIAQAAPSIANMAKQSVVDARRRGGSMKNAFG